MRESSSRSFSTNGQAAWLSQFATSLSYNFTAAGGGSLSGNSANSPTPAQDAKWVNQVIYQGKVSSAAFGTNGFGSVAVPDQHNSPNKLGGPNGMATLVQNSCVTNTAVATANCSV